MHATDVVRMKMPTPQAVIKQTTLQTEMFLFIGVFCVKFNAIVKPLKTVAKVTLHKLSSLQTNQFKSVYDKYYSFIGKKILASQEIFTLGQ